MELFQKIIKKPGVFFLLICIFSFMLTSAGGAQTPVTRLYFDPDPLVIDTSVNSSGVVNLKVADGVDLFAFDIQFSYDPSLLRINSIGRGPFLADASVCMEEVNDPGLFHYACTKFGTSVGDSGSGTLFILTFEALGDGGETTLSLDGSEIYDWPHVFAVDLDLEDGTLEVVGAPASYKLFLPMILNGKAQISEGGW